MTNIQKDNVSICRDIEQVLECKRNIAECEMELRRHKFMNAIDFTGLVVYGLMMFMKKQPLTHDLSLEWDIL